jgi:hypothetical protein
MSDVGLDVLERADELRELDLEGTAVTDAGLIRLSSLTNLRVLNLSGTHVTSSGVRRLSQELPGCRIDLKAGENPLDATPSTVM